MKEVELWDTLNSEIEKCRACSRLVDWREKVAREKRRAYKKQDYWGKPVPGFGDRNAQIMILGLAPGAHGSNRTGRMFTGDASGDFLFPALFREEFSNKEKSISVNDGLVLKKVYITAVCRCAPPSNKPTRLEQINCQRFLLEELSLLVDLQGIVALGGIAFNNAFDIIKSLYDIRIPRRPKFIHGKLYKWEESHIWLLASYHPSRQNTQTGRLTKEMFSMIWSRVNQLINDSHKLSILKEGA
ncbi:MAG: uracil-DNA glycosylase [Anaerolineaceae bacterium]|nr:uracil-DNA glycosylase [Anaerolineaceae bacterium]